MKLSTSLLVVLTAQHSVLLHALSPPSKRSTTTGKQLKVDPPSGTFTIEVNGKTGTGRTQDSVNMINMINVAIPFAETMINHYFDNGEQVPDDDLQFSRDTQKDYDYANTWDGTQEEDMLAASARVVAEANSLNDEMKKKMEAAAGTALAAAAADVTATALSWVPGLGLAMEASAAVLHATAAGLSAEAAQQQEETVTYIGNMINEMVADDAFNDAKEWSAATGGVFEWLTTYDVLAGGSEEVRCLSLSYVAELTRIQPDGFSDEDLCYFIMDLNRLVEDAGLQLAYYCQYLVSDLMTDDEATYNADVGDIFANYPGVADQVSLAVGSLITTAFSMHRPTDEKNLGLREKLSTAIKVPKLNVRGQPDIEAPDKKESFGMKWGRRVSTGINGVLNVASLITAACSFAEIDRVYNELQDTIEDADEYAIAYIATLCDVTETDEMAETPALSAYRKIVAERAVARLSRQAKLS